SRSNSCKRARRVIGNTRPRSLEIAEPIGKQKRNRRDQTVAAFNAAKGEFRAVKQLRTVLGAISLNPQITVDVRPGPSLFLHQGDTDVSDVYEWLVFGVSLDQM